MASAQAYPANFSARELTLLMPDFPRSRRHAQGERHQLRLRSRHGSAPPIDERVGPHKTLPTCPFPASLASPENQRWPETTDDRLRLVERIEKRRGITDDIRDVYLKAKAVEYDVKIMRQIVGSGR